MKKRNGWLIDFFNLWFPRLCAACGNNLMGGEAGICSYCLFHLPKTHFHNDLENPVFQSFWGRTMIERGAAWLYFTKGNRVQELLHQLKYKGNREVGFQLGYLYGLELKATPGYKDIEFIVPVPLHSSKERKRGYNQSRLIAEGLSSAMGVSVLNGALVRKVSSSTQTKKSRFNRWKNVEKVFEVKHKDSIRGKRLLLVDDVVTTGATLEACASTLLAIEGVEVSVVALAYASY